MIQRDELTTKTWKHASVLEDFVNFGQGLIG